MFQFRKSIRVGVYAAAGIAGLMAAPAIAATNLDFETGDNVGWATHGNAHAVTAYGAFAPVAGEYLGAVEAGLGQNTYSTIKQRFTLTAGGTISGMAGFQANDYAPFDDDAYLAVNGVKLMTWSVDSVGDLGNSGWDAFSFTALTDGVYTLELAVTNRSDNDWSSGAVLDQVVVTGVAAVPETATWAMMVVGFGLAGASLRTRRSAVSFG